MSTDVLLADAEAEELPLKKNCNTSNGDKPGGLAGNPLKKVQQVLDRLRARRANPVESYRDSAPLDRP